MAFQLRKHIVLLTAFAALVAILVQQYSHLTGTTCSTFIMPTKMKSVAYFVNWVRLGSAFSPGLFTWDLC